jgi:hypothetical protein
MASRGEPALAYFADSAKTKRKSFIRLAPVRPAAERQDEGRGQPGRRVPHRLQVQEERRENGEKTILR